MQASLSYRICGFTLGGALPISNVLHSDKSADLTQQRVLMQELIATLMIRSRLVAETHELYLHPESTEQCECLPMENLQLLFRQRPRQDVYYICIHAMRKESRDDNPRLGLWTGTEAGTRRSAPGSRTDLTQFWQSSSWYQGQNDAGDGAMYGRHAFKERKPDGDLIKCADAQSSSQTTNKQMLGVYVQRLREERDQKHEVVNTCDTVLDLNMETAASSYDWHESTEQLQQHDPPQVNEQSQSMSPDASSGKNRSQSVDLALSSIPARLPEVMEDLTTSPHDQRDPCQDFNLHKQHVMTQGAPHDIDQQQALKSLKNKTRGIAQKIRKPKRKPIY